MITEFALYLFTTLGGVAAGLYVAAAFFPADKRRAKLLASIIPLLLLAVGGIALLIHLGHPERALNMFSNLAAGITIEGCTTMLFGILLVADLIVVLSSGNAFRALRFAGAAAGVLMTVAMGYAYFSYDSVPAWHSPATFLLFCAPSLAAGFVLWGAICEKALEKNSFVTVSVVLAVVAALSFSWEIALFVGVGFGIAPSAVATILVLLGAAVVYLSASKQQSRLWRLALVLVLVALAVGRYGFYTAI